MQTVTITFFNWMKGLSQASGGRGGKRGGGRGGNQGRGGGGGGDYITINTNKYTIINKY